MLKSLLPKIAIGTLGAGGLIGGIVYANLPDKYSNYLNKQGRVLLVNNSSKWEEMKNKYASEGDGLLISINNKEIAKDQLTTSQLKDWCSKNSNNKFTNTKDSNYQRVSAWCTEPKKIKDLVGKNMIILNDEEVSNGTHPNDKEWKSKKDEYSKLTDNNLLIKKISGNAESTEISASGFSDEKKLRNWCKFSKEKHFKHEEDQRFLRYKKWCTNNKN